MRVGQERGLGEVEDELEPSLAGERELEGEGRVTFPWLGEVEQHGLPRWQRL